MDKSKKAILVLYIFLFLISLNFVYSQVGCCINPNAGDYRCTPDSLVSRDRNCCPNQQTNPEFYYSTANPTGPRDYNECIANYFVNDKSCSLVDACRTQACCCSETGGTIRSEVECRGSDQTFIKEITDASVCGQRCAIPQCNDGIDNDRNGCADTDDTGCDSREDRTESGGACLTLPTGCENALSDLDIKPVKGQKKFSLTWKDRCSQDAKFYEVLRCKGKDCTSFEKIATSGIRSFEDASDVLLFNTIYNFKIKANYNSQIVTPETMKEANLGNLECFSQSNDIFCIQKPYYDKYKNYLMTNFPNDYSESSFAQKVASNFGNRFNKAFSCSSSNILVPKGQANPCSPTQVCVVTNNVPSCINTGSCAVDTNPFGMFYTSQSCESQKYCFYDKSHTTVNSCFNCNPSMNCYDYKTEDACSRDNCKISNCEWKKLENQLGLGVCVKKGEYNCQWCEKEGTESLENLNAYNKVFDLCTKEKSDVLSVGDFKCYFKDGKSKNCEDVVCTDYDESQCNARDICNIKVCNSGLKDAAGYKCAKNADGDDKADCADAENRAICESDYFAPETKITVTKDRKGINDGLIIQIYDKTSAKSQSFLRTSQDYITSLCLESCSKTTSRIIILSGLGAFDSDGKKILSLKEGANIVRYYSQDPAKNVGNVESIRIEAYTDIGGPQIVFVDIDGSSKINGKIYTNNLKPVINVKFLEGTKATITFARLISKDKKRVISLQGNAEASDKVSLLVPQPLANDEYTLEINAKNDKNIFMFMIFSVVIVIDNINPTLNIAPSDGTVVNVPDVEIRLTFNEEVNLSSVKINSEEAKGNFSTADNKVFTARIRLSDGNKRLEVIAQDFAKNSVSKSVSFIVDAEPTSIRLVSPKFGTASTYTFDIEVETDNNANCKYSLATNYDFEFMKPFTSTGITQHKISNFNEIPSGDAKTYKLYVRCDAKPRDIASASFDINVDASLPLIKSTFAFPNPIIERPLTTRLTLEADELVICKFSKNSQDFGRMEGKFEGFDNNDFKIINRQEVTATNEGDFSYFVACKNKAGLVSVTNKTSFKVNLSVPVSITSHTNDLFSSKDVVLAVETNKKTQCKFSQTDETLQTGEIFGVPGYNHQRQLRLESGRYQFYVECKDTMGNAAKKTIAFVIDTTKPSMLFVDDTHSTALFPEKTCNKDKLRVKWLGEDSESGVKEYYYSLIKKVGNAKILDWTKTIWYSNPRNNDEWKWIENLNLDDNTQYFFDVKAKNYADLESDSKQSDGVTVETSACLPAPRCGDGKIDPGELCDGNIFGSITSCAQYTNFIGGTLKCTNDCRLDTSECTKVPTCGNKEIDVGEACDGSIFGSVKSCADYGISFSGGNLKCTSTCQLDTSNCIEKAKCGNGVINQGEACDGTNLGLQSNKCIDYNPLTFSGGTLSCANNCQLDTSKCEGVQGNCGDGKIDVGEACDGSIFGSVKSCIDYSGHFSVGNLKCNSRCQIDTSECVEAHKCGNKGIDKGESCDTLNLGPLSGKCADYSSDFNSGTIKCTSDCRLDTSSCVKAPACGNNKIDTGELCDGTNFGDIKDLKCNSYNTNFIEGTISCKSCQIDTSGCKTKEITRCGDGKIDPGELCDDKGPLYGTINSCNSFTNFIGGTLGCSNCQFDTTNCVRQKACGDGTLQSGEHCDGRVFGTADSCDDLWFVSGQGQLACTPNCFIDTSKCVPKQKCGNGIVDSGEECDGNNLGPLNAQCSPYSSLFTGGTLKCNSNCKFDTSGCFGVSGACGNEIINIGEACDGTAFGTIKACTDYKSFKEGSISCDKNCKLETSNCVPVDKCGNGLIDPNEECDGTNLGILNANCKDFSPYFKSGSLKCGSDCKLDTFSCEEAPKCGNNFLDTGEVCDGSNFGDIKDRSCSNYSSNFVEGTISCRSCQIDTSGCKTKEITSCKDRGECGLNEQCNDNSDCKSKFCLRGKCAEASCDDKIQNQGESSADCGGPCKKCDNELKCNNNNDCKSNFCNRLGFCKDLDESLDNCGNYKLDPNEADIDCGGACIVKCAEGKSCIANDDCISGFCKSSICTQEQEDSDKDGLPDAWEIANGLDPNNPDDANLDQDGDGLTNFEEYQVQNVYQKSTDPNNIDTDGDGFSDKKEIDEGTSPIDPEAFPKSSMTKIILFVFGIVILLSGFGYLAYTVVTRRKEEMIEMPKERQMISMPRVPTQPQIKQIPLKQREEAIRSREMLKEKEREKLFGAFEKEKKEESKETVKDTKIEKAEVKETKEKKPTVKIRKKTVAKKPKEEVFQKLKEIASEAKSKKISKKRSK